MRVREARRGRRSGARKRRQFKIVAPLPAAAAFQRLRARSPPHGGWVVQVQPSNELAGRQHRPLGQLEVHHAWKGGGRERGGRHSVPAGGAWCALPTAKRGAAPTSLNRAPAALQPKQPGPRAPGPATALARARTSCRRQQRHHHLHHLHLCVGRVCSNVLTVLHQIAHQLAGGDGQHLRASERVGGGG